MRRPAHPGGSGARRRACDTQEGIRIMRSAILVRRRSPLVRRPSSRWGPSPGSQRPNESPLFGRVPLSRHWGWIAGLTQGPGHRRSVPSQTARAHEPVITLSEQAPDRRELRRGSRGDAVASDCLSAWPATMVDSAWVSAPQSTVTATDRSPDLPGTATGSASRRASIMAAFWLWAFPGLRLASRVGSQCGRGGPPGKAGPCPGGTNLPAA